MVILDERGRHIFGSSVSEDGRLQLVSNILENGFRVFDIIAAAIGAAVLIRRRRRR